MIRLEWLVAAKGASIDRESGQITIYAIFTGISAQSFPLIIPSLSIVGLLRRDKGDAQTGTLSLRVKRDGELKFQGDIPFNFGDKLNNQLAIQLHGAVIEGPGDIEFSLAMGRRMLRSYAVQVEGSVAEITEGKKSSGTAVTTATEKTSRPKRKKKKASR
jgi:hypothetical protein